MGKLYKIMIFEFKSFGVVKGDKNVYKGNCSRWGVIMKYDGKIFKNNKVDLYLIR